MQIEYFQLIDRIIDLDVAGRQIKVEAIVPATSSIFEGHFPGQPLMPGVLLIEAMAQTSGWLLLALNRLEKMPFLVGVRQAKLRHFVQPGSQLHITAGIAHEGSGFAITDATIKIADQVTCEANLTFSIQPFPDAALRQHMEALARRLNFPLQTVTHG